MARWSPLPTRIYVFDKLLLIKTGLESLGGIFTAKTIFPSKSNRSILAKMGTLNFDVERRVDVKSCSIFSGLSTPTISKVETFFSFSSRTPRIIQPPVVLEKALTVSHMDLGRPPEASLTSKSFHSTPFNRHSSSSFVIVVILSTQRYGFLEQIFITYHRN